MMRGKVVFSTLCAMIISSGGIFAQQGEERVTMPEISGVGSDTAVFASTALLQPEFPGGRDGMFHYLSKTVHYPDSAFESGIQGKVRVRFVVEKNGRITNAQVMQSDNAVLNAEALRVVRSMPRWKPARKDGEPVRVTFELPITFRLN
jgi:protein TonB